MSIWPKLGSTVTATFGIERGEQRLELVGLEQLSFDPTRSRSGRSMRAISARQSRSSCMPVNSR